MAYLAPANRKKTPDEESAAEARRWISELGTSERAQQKWLTRSRGIFRKYKQERGERAERGYALLYSNTQTILPAAFSRPPEPVVSRRFKDADPVARVATEVLERGLSYSVDANDLGEVLRTAALDYVLIARCQTWERYVPTYGPEQTEEVKVLQVTTDAGVCYETEDGDRYDAETVEEDGEGGYVAKSTYRPVIFEQSITDYVSYEDFGHTPARTWNEVWYVWRRVFMSRKQLVERFGKELGNKIPLDYPAKQSGSPDEVDMSRRAAIYEVWDKNERCALWISKSWPDAVLDKRADPLRLDGFFPCPRPALGVIANDSLIPVPDYIAYQDQAKEIDELTAKIGELQKALKVVGFYAGEAKLDLTQALESPNGTLVPVADWKNFAGDGGVNGKVEWWPIDKVVTTLKACIDLRAQIIQDVYQITGVADILRGATDPGETYGAQSLKAQWGSLRIRDRQKELARFARDVLRIKGEVMAEHFSPETFAAMTGVQLPTAADKAQLELQARQAAMTGQQVPPQILQALQSPTWEDVVAMLRDNAARAFRIDIETDSTIEPNEQEEKAQTVELLQAVASFMQQWGPVVQQAPQLGPMAAEMLKFAMRRFRAGRELEQIIEQSINQLMGAAQQPQPQEAAPPPDKTPVEVAGLNLQREQVKQQGENFRTQLQAQVDGADMALRERLASAKVFALGRDPTPQATA